jgi:hypothetical protein
MVQGEGRMTLPVNRFALDEHIERGARLVLVGITPGPTQLELSYEEAGKLIRSGASDETVLREAKRAGFGGSSMRPNLVRMLNHFDFAGIYGLEDVETFWSSLAAVARNILFVCVPKIRFGLDAASGRRKLAS